MDAICDDHGVLLGGWIWSLVRAAVGERMEGEQGSLKAFEARWAA
jgi:hypothetical protein